MIPLHTDYTTAVPPGDLLGLVRFGSSVHVQESEASITVATPSLLPPSMEVWRSPTTLSGGRNGAVAFRRNEDILYGVVIANNGDLEQLTARTYANIIQSIRSEGFPHLLRVWNYVRDINAGSGDDERYKRFCAGRYQALTDAGLARDQFPAASAVGMHGGDLAIHFIAAREPGRQVENARQVSAYDYPRPYGRRPPSFSRATVARFGSDAVLFISGTASIVGHETVHRGDVAAQAEETLANLEAVAGGCRASLQDLHLVKVYVRRPADVGEVTTRLQAAMPQAKLMAVHADVCRADLLLEVEAMAMLRDRGTGC